MNLLRQSVILIISSLVLAGLGVACLRAQNISFAPPVNYAAGTQPISVAVGDFNGDGIPDLAVVNKGSNSVSILLGNTDGTFQPAVSYAAGTQPESIAVGDFNRDGKLDLAIADTQGNDVAILLGDGTGAFPTHVSYATGTAPKSLVLGDFNHDGKLDMAVVDIISNSGNVSVLLGNGDGTFQQAVNYPVGGDLKIVAGDFSRDGNLDLAVVGSGVSVLLGNGDGTFQAAVSYPTGPDSNSVTVGDFNGNGKVDLAVANNTSNNVSILLGNGDGTFQPAVNYAAGTSPFSVVAGDFDGDGKLDLAVVNSDSGSFSILPGNGDGTFQAAVNYTVGTAAYSIAVGDFNRDTKLDMAALGSNVNILLNTTPPTATVTTVTSSPNQAIVGTAITFTATVSGSGGTPTGTVQFMDGSTAMGSPATLSGGQATYTTDSLATGTYYPIHAVYSGDANFAPSDSAFMQVPLGSYPSSIAMGDLNRDGKLDLAFPTWVSVLLGQGDGAFQPVAGSELSTGNNPALVVLGDFNGDGKLDAIGPNDYGGFNLLLGNGDGTFQAPLHYPMNESPSAFAVGDFNHDGKLDLAMAINSNPGTVEVLLGNGDGTFQTPESYTVGTGPVALAVGDFNRDGKLDLAVGNANGSSGSVSILLGNGNGTFQPAVNLSTTTDALSIAVGDFNRDGKLDLAVGGEDVDVLLGNGDGTFQLPVNYPMSVGAHSIAVGDFNRDGNLDLVAGNRDYRLYVLLGNGDGTFQPAMVYNSEGSGPLSIAVGDFNRDGKLDLAAANYVSKSVSILTGEGTGSFSQPLTEIVGPTPTVAFGPAPVFPATVVGQTSPTVGIALFDTGTISLNITAVSIRGDFAIASNDCTATLAANGYCTVNVTFSPTAAGTRTGALSFTDDGVGSPQSVSLSGVGEDFAVNAQTTSQTITPGATATYDLHLSPKGGFNQTVNLSCSGAPQGSTCTANPASTTLDGINDAAVVLKVATTGSALLVPGDPGNTPPPSGGLSMAGWLALFGLLLIAALAKFSSQSGRARRLAPFATLALLAMLAVACGGGSSSSSASSSGTPAGSYTLTVTGRSGSLTHAAHVTLKVQ